jgi:hypothetical protein
MTGCPQSIAKKISSTTIYRKIFRDQSQNARRPHQKNSVMDFLIFISKDKSVAQIFGTHKKCAPCSVNILVMDS